MEDMLVMLLEIHKVVDSSFYSTHCDGAFKFGDTIVEFDDDPRLFYETYLNGYIMYNPSVFMVVDRHFPFVRHFGGYYGHPSNKFVPSYDTCYYMYTFLITLKDKKLQVSLPDGQIVERPYNELKFYINLLLTFVHFSLKRGGVGVAKMFIEDDLTITKNLASHLSYFFTRVQHSISLFSPKIVNPFMEMPLKDFTIGNVKSDEESGLHDIFFTTRPRVGYVLAPSFFAKDLKVSLVLVSVRLKNQKIMKFILERGLENYQAAFLALRAIAEKDKALLIRVLEMSKIDINLINEKIISLCRRTILGKSEKAIDITKTLINVYGLEMSNFGYLILQAAVSTKNFELVSYLTEKKSKYDEAGELKKGTDFSYNQRYKAVLVDLREIKYNGLSDTSNASKYSAEMIKFLINRGANPTANNYEVLLRVIRKEDYSTLEFLLKNGINLQKCPPRYNGMKTASLYCNNKLKMIKFLVENGADPVVCKNIALKCACRSNDYELVKYLLSNGVSPRFSAGNGLKELCSGKRWDGKIFRALVEGGANPEAHKGLAMKRVWEENDTASIEFIEKRMAKKVKKDNRPKAIG